MLKLKTTAPVDYLISTLQGTVESLDKLWDSVGRVQTLVWVHLASSVGITSHLPAAAVDGWKASTDLLHSLVACHGSQRVHVRHLVHQLPKPLGTTIGESVLNLDRALQPRNILWGVWTDNASPPLGVDDCADVLGFDVAVGGRNCCAVGSAVGGGSRHVVCSHQAALSFRPETATGNLPNTV